MRIWCFIAATAAVACLQLPALAQNKEAAKAAALQAEVMKKIMARFDLNDDGNVDDEEKAKAVDQFTKDIDDGKIPDGFSAVLDRNKNGKLEPLEAAAFQSIIAALQGRGGGAPQFGAGNAGPGGPGLSGPGFGGPGFAGGAAGAGNDPFAGQVPPEILKKYDKNKDGELDEKEKKAAMAAYGPKKTRAQRLQETLDLNGDGKVTKEEREQVAAQRKAEAEEKKAAAAEKKAKAKAKKDDKEADEDKEEQAKEKDKPAKE